MPVTDPLLEDYLFTAEDNLNPLLRKMVADGVSLYGVPGENELELVNINRYPDYIKVLKGLKKS